MLLVIAAALAVVNVCPLVAHGAVVPLEDITEDWSLDLADGPRDMFRRAAASTTTSTAAPNGGNNGVEYSFVGIDASAYTSNPEAAASLTEAIKKRLLADFSALAAEDIVQVSLEADANGDLVVTAVFAADLAESLATFAAQTLVVEATDSGGTAVSLSSSGTAGVIQVDPTSLAKEINYCDDAEGKQNGNSGGKKGHKNSHNHKGGKKGDKGDAAQGKQNGTDDAQGKQNGNSGGTQSKGKKGKKGRSSSQSQGRLNQANATSRVPQAESREQAVDAVTTKAPEEEAEAEGKASGSGDGAAAEVRDADAAAKISEEPVNGGKGDHDHGGKGGKKGKRSRVRTRRSKGDKGGKKGKGEQKSGAEGRQSGSGSGDAPAPQSKVAESAATTTKAAEEVAPTSKEVETTEQKASGSGLGQEESRADSGEADARHSSKTKSTKTAKAKKGNSDAEAEAKQDCVQRTGALSSSFRQQNQQLLGRANTRSSLSLISLSVAAAMVGAAIAAVGWGRRTAGRSEEWTPLIPVESVIA